MVEKDGERSEREIFPIDRGKVRLLPLGNPVPVILSQVNHTRSYHTDSMCVTTSTCIAYVTYYCFYYYLSFMSY